MNAHRFDRISKAIAGGMTRRTALRRAGGAGLAGALLATAGPQRGVAQEATPTPPDGGGLCVTPFEFTVRQGPSAGQHFVGTLALVVGATGAIDEGRFLLPDGQKLRVVGQAVGRAISLLVTVGDGQWVYGVGTTEHDIAECRGQMGGPLVGPQAGDTGDWLACCCEDPVSGALPCGNYCGDDFCLGPSGGGDVLDNCLSDCIINQGQDFNYCVGDPTAGDPAGSEGYAGFC